MRSFFRAAPKTCVVKEDKTVKPAAALELFLINRRRLNENWFIKVELQYAQIILDVKKEQHFGLRAIQFMGDPVAAHDPRNSIPCAVS